MITLVAWLGTTGVPGTPGQPHRSLGVPQPQHCSSGCRGVGNERHAQERRECQVDAIPLVVRFSNALDRGAGRTSRGFVCRRVAIPMGTAWEYGHLAWFVGIELGLAALPSRLLYAVGRALGLSWLSWTGMPQELNRVGSLAEGHDH